MDSSAQNNNQNPAVDTAKATPPVSQPMQQPQVQPQVLQPMPQNTVSISKESAPIAIPKPEEKWIAETAPVAKIEEELQEAGVEATKNDVLHVSQEVADAGVAPVGTAAPIPEEPALKFPITEEKAKGILKLHKKVKESITWLALLVVRQMQVLNFNKKKEDQNG